MLIDGEKVIKYRALFFLLGFVQHALTLDYAAGTKRSALGAASAVHTKQCNGGEQEACELERKVVSTTSGKG